MLQDKKKVSASTFKETEQKRGIKIHQIQYFPKETGNDDTPTGRIKYNPIFTKTTNGGALSCNGKNQ